jgi:Vanillate O-demethylase oxygenase C-terminal domain
VRRERYDGSIAPGEHLYKDMTDVAFAEDARMVELQQRLIDGDPSGTPLVSLAFDRAALAARRIITRMLKEEAQAAAAPVKSAERVASHGAGATA